MNALRLTNVNGIHVNGNSDHRSIGFVTVIFSLVNGNYFYEQNGYFRINNVIVIFVWL